MFGLGLPEIIFIVITAIVVLGPDRMPRVAQKLGKLLAKMRSAATSLGDAIAQDESLSELKSDLSQANRAVHDLNKSVSPFASSIPKTVTEALDEVKLEIKARDASPAAPAHAPCENTPAPSSDASMPTSSPTQKLFEHIEKHLNMHSREHAVFVEKPILVSTQIARATSRFGKPLNAPKELTATTCAILLEAPRPERAVEKHRVLAPARVTPTQRTLPLAAPSTSTGLSHIPLKRGCA